MLLIINVFYSIAAQLISQSSTETQTSRDLVLRLRDKQWLSISPDPYYYPPSELFAIQSDENFGNLPLNAISIIAGHLGVLETDLVVASYFTDVFENTHVYLDRTLNGISIKNHNAAVHFKGNQVSSYSCSFNSKPILADANTRFTKRDERKAIKFTEDAFGAKQDNSQAYYSYLEIADGSISFVYRFQIWNISKSIWYLVSIDVQQRIIVLKQAK